MDWFSWLSKAGLDPSLVYEYGLAFANNELEREDISYFNHEFLQSMGVSIAKHRLEIIKLAKKETGRDPHPMSKLLDMIMKTRSCIAHCINTWLHRDEDDGAIVVVHGKKKKKSTAYSKRWRGALLKRSKSMMLLKQERLMLTDESFVPTPSNGTSPMLYDLLRNGEVNGGDSWWPPTAVEDTRWASMFHDLKPN